MKMIKVTGGWAAYRMRNDVFSFDELYLRIEKIFIWYSSESEIISRVTYFFSRKYNGDDDGNDEDDI